MNTVFDGNESRTFPLLPGDKAPELRLSHPINRDHLPSVRFDRLSFIVLWNAGCSSCVPALEKASELAAAHDVVCFGVGVMVHDLAATRERMIGRAPNAIVAVEERPSNAPGLSRGWVTRHWLEPSGQDGVPAAFIIDEKGTIIWMGHPDGMEPAFTRIRQGDWDVAAARQEWQTMKPAESVAHLLIVRDLTDASIAGPSEAALHLIEDAERTDPAIVDNKAYCQVKLSVLAEDPDQHLAAVAHYRRCVETFGDDRDFQLRLAGWVLEKDLPKEALQPLVSCLTSHQNEQTTPRRGRSAWAAHAAMAQRPARGCAQPARSPRRSRPACR